MRSLLRDIVFGVRMLWKSPAFAMAAIATLALGIGANTAIFTVTDALLLRPFPYRAPEQLVNLAVDPTKDFSGTLLRYELLRDRSRSFESVAAFTTDNANLTGRGEPLQVPIGRVSANFFSTLGVQPRLGRDFTDEEGRPEGKPVVILGDSIWRTRFNADPNVIGQTLTLDGTPHTIVGVLPANLQFPFVGGEADIWQPRYFEYSLMPAARLRMGVGYLGYLARLRSGTTLSGADAELAVLDRQYRDQNPTAPDADPSIKTTAQPLRDMVVSDVRGKVLVLSAAMAVVLLIACANVASLLLSRALSRRREMAMRTALGASRRTLIEQLLTESLLMAVIAGVLGIVLGWTATRALVAWGNGQLPQGMPVHMDVRVLLFTIALTVLTGVIFGIAPALQLSGVDLQSTLRDEGHSSSAGLHRSRMKNLLVVGQVALSLLLLIAAGLLLRSFQQLLRVDPGFDSHSVLAMSLSLPTVKYAKPEQQIAFFDELLRRVNTLPGVRNTAISATLPFTVKRITPMLPEGQPSVPLSQRPFIDIEAVSPQWFTTMHVRLRSGRVFTEADNAQAPKVVVVNESFARRFWPNENPVGKHVLVGRATQPAEVVGVAADVRNKGLAQDTQTQIYVPFPQLPWGNMNLLVRTAVPPLSMTSQVRAQIAGLDPEQPVTGIQTIDDLMDDSRAQPRFTMLLLGGFAMLALVLAAVGIYGVLAYSVAGRRRELGIRMALGAEQSRIVTMVLREGLTLACSGIMIGLLAALVLTRIMSALLYRTGSRDIATFVLVPLVFLAIAMLASYLPARRATQVNPVETLRSN